MPKKIKNKKKDDYAISIRKENENARRLMWFSVILFSAVIAILWGWSLKTQLSSLSWQKSTENKLFKNSQEEWNKLFSEQENKIKLDDVKTMLQKQIALMMASSTKEIATTGTPRTTATIYSTSTIAINTTTIIITSSDEKKY